MTGFPLHPPLLLPPLLLLLLPLLLLPLLPLLLLLLPPLLPLALLPAAPLLLLLLPLLLLVAPELPPSMADPAVASPGVEPSSPPPELLVAPELPFDPPELPDDEAWPELAASPPSSTWVSGFELLPPHAISAPTPASAGTKDATRTFCDQRPLSAFLFMSMSSKPSSLLSCIELRRADAAASFPMPRRHYARRVPRHVERHVCGYAAARSHVRGAPPFVSSTLLSVDPPAENA